MVSGNLLGNYEIPLLGALVASALVPSDLLQLPAIFAGAMLAQECTDYYQNHAQDWEKGFRANQIRSAHTFMSLVDSHRLTGFLPASYNTVPDSYPRARTKTEIMFGLSINPAEMETLYNPYFIPSDNLIDSLYTEQNNVHKIPKSLHNAYLLFRKIVKTGEYEHARRIGFVFLRIIDEIIRQLETDPSFTCMHAAEAMRRVHMLLNESLLDHGVVLFEDTTTQFLMTGQDPSVTRTLTRNSFVVPPSTPTPLSLMKAAVTESREMFIREDIPKHIQKTSTAMKKSAQDLLIAVAETHGLINTDGQTSFTPEDLADFTFRDSFKTKLYKEYLSRVEWDRESVSIGEIAADFEKGANTPERKEFARFLAASYVINRQIMCQENIVDIINISGSLSIPQMLPIFDESFFAFSDQVPAIISNIIPVFDSENKKTKIKAVSAHKFNEFKSRLESIQHQVTILRSSSYQRERNDVDYLAELERKVAAVSESFGSQLGEKKKALLKSQVAQVRRRIQGTDYAVVLGEESRMKTDGIFQFLDPHHDAVTQAFISVARQLTEHLKLDTPQSPVRPILDAINTQCQSMRDNFRWETGGVAHEKKIVIDNALKAVRAIQEKFDRTLLHLSSALAKANPEAVSIEWDVEQDVMIWLAPADSEDRKDVKALRALIDRLNKRSALELTAYAHHFKEMAKVHKSHLHAKMTCSSSVEKAIAGIQEGVTPRIRADIDTAAGEYKRQCAETVKFLGNVAGTHECKIEEVNVDHYVGGYPSLTRAGNAVAWMETHAIAPAACIDWWNSTTNDLETYKNRATIDFIYSTINLEEAWNTTQKQDFLRSVIANPDLTDKLAEFRNVLARENTGVWLLSNGYWFLGDLMLRFNSVKLPLDLLVAGTPPISLFAGKEMRSYLALMGANAGDIEKRKAFHTQKSCTLFANSQRQALLMQNRAVCPAFTPILAMA